MLNRLKPIKQKIPYRLHPIRYHKYIFSFYLVIYFLISQYAFQSQIFQNILVKYLFFTCSSASWRDAAKKILVIRMFSHFRRCADNLRSFFGEITDFNMILIKMRNHTAILTAEQTHPIHLLRAYHGK